MPIYFIKKMARYLYGVNLNLSENQIIEIRRTQRNLSWYLDIYLSISIVSALITAIWLHAWTWLILSLALSIAVISLIRWSNITINELIPASATVNHRRLYKLVRFILLVVLLFLIIPLISTILTIGSNNQDFWPTLFSQGDRALYRSLLFGTIGGLSISLTPPIKRVLAKKSAN